MNTPATSVVMGVYNGGDTLPVTIDSVLVQTERDFEFIIVNDGSSDTCVAEILSEYINSDQRIKIISKGNEGLTRALMDGCNVAKGKYIARIDNGDVMLPERLKLQRARLEVAEDIVFVSCWTEFCGPEWEALYDRMENTKPEGDNICPKQPNAYPHVGPSHHGSVMIRRSAYEAVGGYHAEFYFGQDWDLWYRLAERGRFAIVPECLYRARLFSGGISGTNRLCQEKIGQYALAAHWCRRRGEKEDSVLRQAACIRPSYADRGGRGARSDGAHHIAELLRQRGDPRCRRYFLDALRAKPFRVNTLCRIAQSLFIQNKNVHDKRK